MSEEKEDQLLLSNVEDLKGHKPRIEFQTPTMIRFGEVEDLIAYMLQNRFRFIGIPAWRYYCRESREENQNRLYYMIEVGNDWDGEKIKLVSGDATDYSGHGNSDRVLAEFFISKILHLPIEERPLSYLFDELVYEISMLVRERT